MTETMAMELADVNIQVNALSPGSINTRMWEETRDAAQAAGDAQLFEFGRPVTSGGGASISQAAELAIIFASDASDGLNGRVIESFSGGRATLPQRIPDIMASDAGRLTL